MHFPQVAHKVAGNSNRKVVEVKEVGVRESGAPEPASGLCDNLLKPVLGTRSVRFSRQLSAHEGENLNLIRAHVDGGVHVIFR